MQSRVALDNALPELANFVHQIQLGLSSATDPQARRGKRVLCSFGARCQPEDRERWVLQVSVTGSCRVLKLRNPRQDHKLVHIGADAPGLASTPETPVCG